jgi:carboxyl-terminal processing protease
MDDYLRGEVQDEESREVRYTVGGRKVLGQGGIAPDYEFKYTNKLLTFDFLRRGAFFAYAKEFARKETPLSQNFTIPDSEDKTSEGQAQQVLDRDFTAGPEFMNDFQDFLWKKDIPFVQEKFEEAKDQIKREIERAIAAFLWGDEAGRKAYCKNDPVVLKAIDLFPEAEALLKKNSQ